MDLMKTKCILSLLWISLLFMACETERFVPLDDEPVFYVNGLVDGEAFNLEAGLEGVVNNPLVLDQSTHWDYISSFIVNGNSTSLIRKLSFRFNDYPKISSEQELNEEIVEDATDFVLNFTGSEGIVLEPNTDGINELFVTSWLIDGQTVTTQINPIIPLPYLEESDFIDVRYSLNIPNKFRGILISQFGREQESGCHGAINIQEDGDEINISASAINQAFTSYSWSTGSEEDNITVDLESITVVLEAESNDCAFIAQLEINDTNAIPPSLSYTPVFQEGPASLMSNKGLIVELVRNDGKIFRSDFTEQDQDVQLLLNSIEVHNDSSNNLETFRINGTMTLNLASTDLSETMSLSLDELQFSLAIPE